MSLPFCSLVNTAQVRPAVMYNPDTIRAPSQYAISCSTMFTLIVQSVTYCPTIAALPHPPTIVT